MEAYKIDKNNIKLHNIVFAITSEQDYEMKRYLLLKNLEDLNYGEYVIVEGYHYSCYDFDDTEWEATIYTEDELIKLAKENIEKNTWWGEEKKLYKFILEYFKED